MSELTHESSTRHNEPDRALDHVARRAYDNALPNDTWVHVNEIIEQAAYKARLYSVDDPVDFSREVAGCARLKALEVLPKVKALDCPEAYVRAVVRTTAIDLFRRYIRDKKRFVSGDAIEAAAHDVPTDAPSPEEALLAAERAARINAAFHRLELEHPLRARVVWLRDVEGRETVEIAELEQTTRSNVHQILHRGREHLRRCYCELSSRSVHAAYVRRRCLRDCFGADFSLPAFPKLFEIYARVIRHLATEDLSFAWSPTAAWTLRVPEHFVSDWAGVRLIR